MVERVVRFDNRVEQQQPALLPPRTTLSQHIQHVPHLQIVTVGVVMPIDAGACLPAEQRREFNEQFALAFERLLHQLQHALCRSRSAAAYGSGVWVLQLVLEHLQWDPAVCGAIRLVCFTWRCCILGAARTSNGERGHEQCRQRLQDERERGTADRVAIRRGLHCLAKRDELAALLQTQKIFTHLCHERRLRHLSPFTKPQTLLRHARQ